jgi:hypothetical protein
VQHSQLWGEHGEQWTPQSRLPDFSFAGYQRGEQPLPDVPSGVSVKEFGAKGDGTTDDTKAFQDALAHVRRGTIEVPAGRYRITDQLEITRPSVVLRGEGPDTSILFFPIPLNDIRPDWGATTTGRRTSNYSWSGGFILLRGAFNSRKIVEITETAERGDQQLVVGSAETLAVGQEIEVHQSDTPENSLAIHLYAGDAGSVRNLKGKASSSLVCRISGINGLHLTIDRPLRCELRPEWNPHVRTFAPTVTESGIENLGFEFPVTPYQGHFTELGYNPVALRNVAHCWVRNIAVRNADSGPFVGGYFNTLQDIVLMSERPSDNQECAGHHGITLVGGDNLVRGFEIRTRFIHDLTVSAFCSGNVFSGGSGVDLSLDHHRRAPFESLFTDLDAGAGQRLWKCGGGAGLGKHCAARGTFWNIRAGAMLDQPPESFGPPMMNFIALHSYKPSMTNPEGRWFEPIAPETIRPRNLHDAQRARRLATQE